MVLVDYFQTVQMILAFFYINIIFHLQIAWLLFFYATRVIKSYKDKIIYIYIIVFLALGLGRRPGV